MYELLDELEDGFQGSLHVSKVGEGGTRSSRSPIISRELASDIQGNIPALLGCSQDVGSDDLLGVLQHLQADVLFSQRMSEKSKPVEHAVHKLFILFKLLQSFPFESVVDDLVGSFQEPQILLLLLFR